MSDSAVVLSIVIPALNEARCIGTTLQALQAMRARGAEVIVVDGGSEDETVRIAMPLADQVLSSRRGRAHQMNAGAALASGKVLLFLHADTLLPYGALECLLHGLSTSALAWGRFDLHIVGRSPMLGLISFMVNCRTRWTGIATGDQAIFVRKEDFLAVGGFPEQPLMEDIEISARLKKRSPPLCLREKVRTSGRRWESRGIVRTVFLMWRLRLLYWLGVSPHELVKAYR